MILVRRRNRRRRMPTEEKYKEMIEIGMGLIEEKLMEKFGLSSSDVEDIMLEYYGEKEWKELLKEK